MTVHLFRRHNPSIIHMIIQTSYNLQRFNKYGGGIRECGECPCERVHMHSGSAQVLLKQLREVYWSILKELIRKWLLGICMEADLSAFRQQNVDVCGAGCSGDSIGDGGCCEGGGLLDGQRCP